MDDDTPAGLFLDLDDAEVNSETVLDIVDFFSVCREGLGGRAWFEIGSIPTSHISYFQTRK